MKKKIILIIVLILIGIYGFFIEPNMLTVTHYKIQDKNLSGIKAVFVGDFHFHKNVYVQVITILKLDHYIFLYILCLLYKKHVQHN